MIEVNIPGFGDLALEHLVLDYNGTLALDGKLLPGVTEVLGALEKELAIHIVTNSFWEALELLRNPRRLIATLRS